jgi:hypothetical protein
LLNGDIQVSQGTGFFYARLFGEQGAVFLVTNYHVLTGHAPLEEKDPIGDNIVFQFHTSLESSAEVKKIRFPLFTRERRPVWIQSASVPDADLAVIPIPAKAYEGCTHAFISNRWITESNLKLRPTGAATLIGYPYGFYDRKNALPIWKTGSFASEPDVDFEGKPLLTIDISAFPGMSGSPAFAISYGTYETEDGNTTVGSSRKFVGIYASMQMLREKKFLEEFHGAHPTYGITLAESLQLGHVWKARLVEELVASIDLSRWEAEVGSNLP